MHSIQLNNVFAITTYIFNFRDKVYGITNIPSQFSTASVHAEFDKSVKDRWADFAEFMKTHKDLDNAAILEVEITKFAKSFDLTK